MKFLFITQYFPPESEIGGIRISEIAGYLTKQGHEITVLTGFPNYPSGHIFPQYKPYKLFFTERNNGINVIRTLLYPSHSKNSFKRFLNYFSFAATSSFRGLLLSKPDVVIATSPPLTVGFPAHLVSTFNNVPLVIEIRDLWPEALIELGFLRNSIAIKSSFLFERFLYNDAHKIVTLSKGIKDDIISRGISSKKCVVLPNGVNLLLFKEGTQNKELMELKQKGYFIGIYLGSLGTYHGLDLAVQFFLKLKKLEKVKIVIVGGGAERFKVEKAIRNHNLKNVMLLPLPSRERMSEFISSADFSLVFLKKSKFSRWLISSKIFMYMACGKPIVGAAAGETREIIEEANAGIIVDPEKEKIDELVNIVSKLICDTLLRRKLGINGRRFVEENFSWKTLARRYETILLNIRKK